MGCSNIVIPLANYPVTSNRSNTLDIPECSILKIQIELKKGPGIKKIHFLTSLVNNYNIKKILWRFVNKLLDDKTVELEVEPKEYNILKEFEKYMDIDIVD